MFHFARAFSRTAPPHAGRWRVEEAKRCKLARPGVRRPGNDSTPHAARPAILAQILIMSLLALASPRAADAQVLYGSLTGNVADQAGAVVQEARVEALNVSTGVSRNTTTDERGVYLFGNLQAGVYKVTIEAASFQTLVHEGVRVDANMVRRLDAELQAAGVSETI